MLGLQVVNEAYHVLADESKRATYDKYGREGVASAEGGAADPVEIMKSMFGGDAFEDTFGELNMWETMRMQFMMASGAQLTEEQAQERLQKFAMERQVLLTEKLVAKLVPFVADDVAKFKELIEGDLESKVAAPGGVALLAAIGYVYCQMAQQYMDKFLGIGSFFAKVAEKGHRFKNNMSALGAAVKLTYSAVKLQAKMEAEEQERMRAEEERQRKWMAEHPGELPPGVPAITADNYPFEQDENWKAYERKVEIPAGVDREAALKKVKAKWFEKNIEPHVPKPHVPKEGEAEGAGMGESAEKEPDPLGDHETMRVFDQGLRLMWKLGVMEAEEIARQICREVCDAKSEYNVKAKTSKDVLKKRVTAIHHIGEKFKAVAARLKKDEKKGFTVQDFIDSEMKKEGNGAETPAGGNDNNAPLNPQPETKIDETVPAAAKAMDVD